jgi:hypothetical protein
MLSLKSKPIHTTNQPPLLQRNIQTSSNLHIQNQIRILPKYPKISSYKGLKENLQLPTQESRIKLPKQPKYNTNPEFPTPNQQ